MGEVYKATDTRLDRTVAIKVLPDVLASEADRLARSFTLDRHEMALLLKPRTSQSPVKHADTRRDVWRQVGL